ncbi:MAG: DUF1697 domain-containing protein [Armatimonas sp.]
MSSTRRWIAFIRAINGSPHNRIKMVDLAAVVTSAGVEEVTWYLQTGNLFFTGPDTSDELAERIEAALIERGLKSAEVMLRTPESLAVLVASNPFADIDSELHHRSVSFFRRPPTKDAREKIKASGSQLIFQDDSAYCLAIPKTADLSGGASATLDRAWGAPSTTRWWHVVEEISRRASAPA